MLRVLELDYAHYAALLAVPIVTKALVSPLLYRVAPGWDIFRGQERAAYLVAVGLSLLAALGLARLPDAGSRFRRRFALA